MSSSDVLTFGLKIVTGLIVLVILFRLFGNKELAQTTPLDLVFVVILADLVAGVITDNELNALHLVYLTLLWVIFIYLLQFVINTFRRANTIIQGEPVVVIKDGELQIERLKELRITENELYARLRVKGYFEITEIELGIIEVSGEISIKEKG